MTIEAIVYKIVKKVRYLNVPVMRLGESLSILVFKNYFLTLEAVVKINVGLSIFLLLYIAAKFRKLY
jgi:hypothetical protein